MLKHISMVSLTSALVFAGCSEEAAEPVRCEDAIIQDLGLQVEKVSEGAVSTSEDGGDFVSLVDATAGGFMNTAMNPYVYMKFTDSGLTKVDIGDEEALNSSDWDIAAKRFIVRLNSGVSGTSTVEAAMLTGMAYADVTAVPAGTQFAAESFYDDSCTIIPDDIGLGTAEVALTGWWEYPAGCVATTLTPAVIKLANDRHVKLVIETYYGVNQQTCNDLGEPGMSSANLTFRWQFLD